MRLFHLAPSRSTQVLWLLEEIGAPYDLTLVTREEKVAAKHRQRHPLGRVPVIEEEGGFVFETAAIMLHLADLHPEAELIPAVGSHERALAYQWVVFAKTELEPPILAARDGDPEAAGAGRERFSAAAQVVEDTLADSGEYLVGGRFTVADVQLGSIVLLAKRNELLEGFPGLEAYAARLAARPARERAVAIGTTT